MAKVLLSSIYLRKRLHWRKEICYIVAALDNRCMSIDANISI